MSHQAEFFTAVATRNLVRPTVRAIVMVDRQLLVQRPADEPASFYAFIGGAGRPIHGLDHFCEVTLDRREIGSRESHLTQHWLSLDRIEEYDLRPTVVRDALRDGTWRDVRHLAT